MRKSIMLVLVALFFVGVGNATQIDTTKAGTYSEGKVVGESMSKGNEMCIGCGSGCLFGALGYLYPFCFSHEPEAGVLLETTKGKSEEYKAGFIDGYKHKKRSEAMKGTTGGCLLSSIGAIIYTIVVIAAASSE